MVVHPRGLLFLLGLCLAGAGLTPATAAGEPGLFPAPKPVMTNTNSPLKQLGPGLYEVGGVRFNKAKRQVSFPAVLNLTEGPVEYLLVSAAGKLHESVLRTEIEPYHLHLAMLLLDAKGAPKGTLREDYAQPVPGDPLTITVSWKTNQTEVSRPAEDLVLNTQAGAVMSRGEWTYSGSRVVEGTFIAQRDRSMVAIMGDIDALINNPRPGRENDEIWRVNTTNCPPVDTAVQVIIQLNNP